MASKDLPWRKSDYCDTLACVEWAETPDAVYVRQSADPDGPVLRFTREEWAVFIRGIAEPVGSR
jgi:uncharacterized protein DUF397